MYLNCSYNYLTQFELFKEMGEPEVEAFNHAISRHGDDFGLKGERKTHCRN